MISCGSIVLTPVFLVAAFSFRHFVEISRNSRLAMYFGDLYPSSQRISDKAVVTLVSGITPIMVQRQRCGERRKVSARLRTHWRHVTYENKVQHDLCSVSFQDGWYVTGWLHSLVHRQSPVVPRNIRDQNPPRENPRNIQRQTFDEGMFHSNFLCKSCHLPSSCLVAHRALCKSCV